MEIEVFVKKFKAEILTNLYISKFPEKVIFTKFVILLGICDLDGMLHLTVNDNPQFEMDKMALKGATPS